MSAVSEFQTAGAKQRKAQSAKLVLVVGFAYSWHSRRAKLVSDSARLDVMAEVDWGGSVMEHIGKHGEVVKKTL